MFIDAADAALVAAIFALGGVVKGVAGFGLPPIVLGLLVLTRPLPEALALALLPMLGTNLWQAIASGALRPTLRRQARFLIAAVLGTVAGAALLGQANTRLLAGLLGVLVAGSAALALFGPSWPLPSPRAERALAPVMGALSGLGTGLTGSFLMPAAPWFAALRLGPDQFVQAFGLGAVAATLTLAAALAAQGMLPPGLGLASAAALAPTFAGMALGRRLRARLSEAVFRRAVQAMLLLLGLYLAGRNLVG